MTQQDKRTIKAIRRWVGWTNAFSRFRLIAALLCLMAVLSGVVVALLLINEMQMSRGQIATASGVLTSLLILVFGLPLLYFQKRSMDSHNLLMGALDVIDAPLTLYNNSQRIVEINSAAAKYYRELGVRAEKGTHIESILRELAEEKFEAPLERKSWLANVMQQRRRIIMSNVPEVVHTESNNTYHQLLVQELDCGHIVDFRADISGLKKKELELKAREGELEESRNEAQASSRAKSEFLANMSHEIRTPMNGVVGMTELLLESDLSSEQQMYARTISNSGLALLTIINDILDFSKVEAGKLQLDPQSFNLRSALEDVSALLATRAHTKGIEVVLNYDQDLPDRLVGDVGRIRQVGTNIAGNAVKFTEAGHVELRINGKVEGDTAKLVVAVKDTGIGIPEDKLESVFSEFEQVDGAANRKFEGTGLGLAISRRLLSLMNSDIQLKSEVGVGSEFSFSLDLPIDSSASVAMEEPVDVDLTGKKVLIVDDLPLNCEILSRWLRSRGMRYEIAQRGLHGIELMQSAASNGEPFDLAIVDFQMPGMDGHELCRQIKAMPDGADLPVILLSSVDQSILKEAVADIGFTACLLKPARADSLLRAIASCFQHESNRAVTTVAGAAHTSANSELAGPANDPAPVVQAASMGSTGGNILVVEDNEVNQLVISSMLDHLGYDVIIASGGEEGVEQFEAQRPDLILMDVSMPGMNGMEATAAIRKQEESMDLVRCPILALTANAMQSDRERCLESGMDDFMTKPVIKEVLQEKLDKWLSLGGSQTMAA